MPGDTIKAEAGAMVTMSNNVDLEAKIEGSTGDALLRCCCAGESLFMSHFSLKPGMVRTTCSHVNVLLKPTCIPLLASSLRGASPSAPLVNAYCSTLILS